MRLMLAAAVTFASATAALAATQVNVTDPASSRQAHVEIGGRLAVQQVPPTSFFHSANTINGPGCLVIADAPSNKALIVQQVHLTVFSGSANNFVGFYDNATCSGITRGAMFLTALGNIPYSFEPGLAIPAGSGFSVYNFSDYGIEVYLDGYTVPSSAAPVAGGQTFQVHGRMPTTR